MMSALVSGFTNCTPYRNRFPAGIIRLTRHSNLTSRLLTVITAEKRSPTESAWSASISIPEMLILCDIPRKETVFSRPRIVARFTGLRALLFGINGQDDRDMLQAVIPADRRAEFDPSHHLHGGVDHDQVG